MTETENLGEGIIVHNILPIITCVSTKDATPISAKAMTLPCTGL